MTAFHLAPKQITVNADGRAGRSLLIYIWRMSGMHQVWMCLIAVVLALISMAPLELQRRIVNEAVDAGSIELMLWLGGIYLGILLLTGALKFVLRMYQGWLSESAIIFGRQVLAGRHAEREKGGEGAGAGGAVTVIGSEIEKVAGFVGEGISQPAVNLGMLVAVGGYMLVVEPTVAIVSLGFLLPHVVLVPVMQRWINRLLHTRIALMRAVSDDVATLPDDDGASVAALTPQFTAIYDNRMHIYVLKFILKGTINLLNGLAPLCVLIIGGYLIIQDQTSPGVIVAFVSGFDRLAGPLRELLDFYRVAAQAVVQHKMIIRWM